MRVLLWEYFNCGAISAAAEDETIRREGRAMLRAIVHDCARAADSVGVVVDAHRAVTFDCTARLFTATPDTFHDCVRAAAAGFDAALVIAPESDGVLEAQHTLAAECGLRWLGAGLPGIAHSADKLRACHLLQAAGVRTPATSSFSAGPTPETKQVSESSDAWVLKPRYGAGCEHTLRFSGTHRCDVSLPPGVEFVQQPFIEGESVSASAIRVGNAWEVLPVVTQRVSTHPGTPAMEYVGGELRLPQPAQPQCEATVLAALDALDLQSGWAGIDLVHTDADEWVVLEVNPRLTTSYVGYRQAVNGNLAARMLGLEETPLEWKPGRYVFDKAGQVQVAR